MDAESANDAADSRMISFVTVVFEEEYDLLELQARSMSKYIDSSFVDAIFVIDNSDLAMSPTRRHDLLCSYGTLKGVVKILSYQDLGISSDINGYIRQQLAKLFVANHLATTWYLALDAKNHFVSSDLEGHIFDKDLKPAIAHYEYSSHPLKSALIRNLAYFGITDPLCVKRFTPTVTPYPLYKQIVIELLAKVQILSGKGFVETFRDESLTEFFLYGAWLVASGQDFGGLYSMQSIRSPTVWPAVVNKGGVGHAIETAVEFNTPIFSIHRKSLWRMNARSAHILSSFWASKGLFDSYDLALTFINEQKLRRPPSDIKAEKRGNIRWIKQRLLHSLSYIRGFKSAG